MLRGRDAVHDENEHFDERPLDPVTAQVRGYIESVRGHIEQTKVHQGSHTTLGPDESTENAVWEVATPSSTAVSYALIIHLQPVEATVFFVLSL